MLRLLIVSVAVLFSFNAAAEPADIEAMDAAARSAQGSSVMFKTQNPQEAMARREAEIRRRQAYEEQMRREEEARREEQMRQMEEERRKALRPVNLFGKGLKIFAEVNGEIITSRDMQDRVNAFVATTQIPVNNQTKDMIIGKVLQSAVNEKIKLQEAEKNGIKITEADLDKGMENFAKANNVSVAKLKKMLAEAEVKENVFRSQMKAELAWSRLVQRKSAQEVNISQSEINHAMEAVAKDIKMQKFMVSEIVIPQKQAKHISDLVENLRHDPRFELYAAQFSQSPSAPNGGRLGWVNKGQLAAPLENALLKMKEGGISEPILLGTDYYILRLEKVYRPGIDKVPDVTEAEVKTMLENKRTDEVAAKYLRDLRNRAIINRKD